MDIKQKLIEKSGLTQKEIDSGTNDEDIRIIMDALLEIRQGKEFLHGNYVNTHGQDDYKYALMQHFMDTKRKYLRADHFIKKLISEGEDPDIELLYDTYADLALYAILGVQLVKHLEQRQSKCT